MNMILKKLNDIATSIHTPSPQSSQTPKPKYADYPLVKFWEKQQYIKVKKNRDSLSKFKLTGIGHALWYIEDEKGEPISAELAEQI